MSERQVADTEADDGGIMRAGYVAPWWWNDPVTRAWIASGACCCPSCKRGRKLIEEDQ